MTIILGMGTGRSGTQSLSRMLNAQTGTICFHEINPACMKWHDTPQTVRSMVREFDDVLTTGNRDVTVDFTRPAKDEGLDRLRQLPAINAIGDVAFYYLAYVPMLAGLGPHIKMPCIRRDRASVIRSFLQAVRVPPPRPGRLRRLLNTFKPTPPTRRRNHWQHHDGTQWALNPKWDSLFPKFEATGLEDAIGQYWDFYHLEAEKFAALYPDQFRIFDIDMMNSQAGQAEILNFCNLPEPFQFRMHHANTL